RRELRVQLAPGFGDRPRVRLVADAREQVGELALHVAYLRDGAVRLRQLVANLQGERHLLLEIFRRRGEARVFLYLERLRVGLPRGGELDGVSAGDGLRAAHVARPEDHAGEARGVEVAHVPDEAVESRLGRDARRAAAAADELGRLLARRRLRLFGRLLHLRRAGRGRSAGTPRDLALRAP